MYRRKILGQQKLDIPFGVELDAMNRWVKLASIMPWDKIEDLYAANANFKGPYGQVSKSGRLAFAALYIQNRLVITDEETVFQIQENPSMQYFCGFEGYSPEAPFDSSLMVHFRKRITAEMMKEISEEAFAEEAKKAALDAAKKNSDDDDDSGGGNCNDGDGGIDGDVDAVESKPKGTLFIDATCCPSDIHYPTDMYLLNHARELTEVIIDRLHEQLVIQSKIFEQLTKHGVIKPRTYREVARRAYMSFTKKRKHSEGELRFAIRQQLQYVRRNLDSIAKQVELGASLQCLDRVLYKKLLVISELYRQQKQMYDDKTKRIEDRIVSIAQPHLRPIVRGKEHKPVEFGAKIATALVGGFSFTIQLEYDNFYEAKYLETSAEEYNRIFGFYPEVIIGDKAYWTNDNRKYCKSKGIRLSCPKKGPKTEEFKEAERELLYKDGCERNAIEGNYGVGKRKYGLALIMTKLYDTTLTAISFGFFVGNMERLLRLLSLPSFEIWQFLVFVRWCCRVRLALIC